MAAWLALDLSLKSTGFALWSLGSELPVCGHWALAPDVSWRGRGYVRLHRNLIDLHRVESLSDISYEETLSQSMVQGNSSLPTIQMLAGLAAHVESFAEAVGATHRAVNMSTWRKHFIGSMPRGTKKPDLKALAMRRCKELGMDPANHDEAEAIGILDYRLSLEGIIPPWRADVLQRQLTPAMDGKGARS
jgi:hypothetical protein